MAKKALIHIIAIMVIGILPWVFAWLTYHHPTIWHHPTSNVGQLVQPIVSMKEISLHPKLTPSERNKWLLALVTPECDEACRLTVERLKNLKKASGKYYDRIELLVISEKKFPHAMPGVTYHRANVTGVLSHKNHLYLVDPKGNMVLYYSRPVAYKGVLKDLKHLLRFSQIG